MKSDYKILSGAGYIFRAGSAYTLLAPGVAGRTAKPDATDPAWLNIGHIDLGYKADAKTDDIYRPVPGTRVLYKKLVTQRGLDVNLTLHELSNLSLEILFGTAALPNSPTAGGQYNPVTSGALIECWLKLQEYGADDNQIVDTKDLYVCLAPPTSAVKRDDKHVQMDITASVLWSQYNTGSLV